MSLSTDCLKCTTANVSGTDSKRVTLIVVINLGVSTVCFIVMCFGIDTGPKKGLLQIDG